MVDAGRIKRVLPTSKWAIVLALVVVAPALLAIAGGETREEMAWIFGGCVLLALLVASEFVKDG